MICPVPDSLTLSGLSLRLLSRLLTKIKSYPMTCILREGLELGTEEIAA